jgi:hypothetical protein
MNRFLLTCLTLSSLVTAAFAERIDLGHGQAVLLSVPNTWMASELPAALPGLPTRGRSLRYVPTNGSNDSVMLSLVPVPDERLADSGTLRAMVEQASQQFVAGSVEGKANLQELKIGRATGFAVTFTDASLVGQPPVKDDYKAMTSCFVYLGQRVLLSATIFSDDMNGKAYTEALRLLKSIALAQPGDAI